MLLFGSCYFWWDSWDDLEFSHFIYFYLPGSFMMNICTSLCSFLYLTLFKPLFSYSSFPLIFGIIRDVVRFILPFIKFVVVLLLCLLSVIHYYSHSKVMVVYLLRFLIMGSVSKFFNFIEFSCLLIKILEIITLRFFLLVRVSCQTITSYIYITSFFPFNWFVMLRLCWS